MCFINSAAESQDTVEQLASGCGLFEMKLTAPDSTIIDKSDAVRYSKQDEFRLITIDASEFEVQSTITILYLLC